MSDKHPGGRPPFYNTAEELQAKIDEYFDHGYRTKKVVIKDKKNGDYEIEVPLITITGLVLYLGFCDRASFYDYEKKSEFTYTIKKARTFIEMEYEEFLKQGNPTGAIFALKNFGWRDKAELDIQHNASDDLKNFLKKLND